jgi:F-type H+-transporting ATPase subunit b
MLIDWFTVGAQALNFIILVWLLKRFLYKPVLAAIDARETRIAAQLADAAAKQAEADTARTTFDQNNQTFDRQRADLMQKATDEVAAERQRLLDAARQAADDLAATRRHALDSEMVTLGASIQRRAGQQVFAIARKALTDLAATGLEAAMVDVFTRRLQAMEPAASADFGTALTQAKDPAVVHSAFDLPEAQRSAVKQALDTTFAADIAIRFQTAPDLVSGIELSAGGQKIAWTIADYLAAMEHDVEAMARPDDAQPGGTPKPAPKPKAKALAKVAKPKLAKA